jgi:hypothetical protein
VTNLLPFLFGYLPGGIYLSDGLFLASHANSIYEETAYYRPLSEGRQKEELFIYKRSLLKGD